MEKLSNNENLLKWLIAGGLAVAAVAIVSLSWKKIKGIWSYFVD